MKLRNKCPDIEFPVKKTCLPNCEFPIETRTVILSERLNKSDCHPERTGPPIKKEPVILSERGPKRFSVWGGESKDLQLLLPLLLF
jgi:hypothetical protein